MVKINYLQLISLNMLVSALYSSNPNSRANQGHFSRSHSLPGANNNSNGEIQRNLSFDNTIRPNQSWLDAREDSMERAYMDSRLKSGQIWLFGRRDNHPVSSQHGRITDWSAFRGHSYPNDFAADDAHLPTTTVSAQPVNMENDD